MGHYNPVPSEGPWGRVARQYDVNATSAVGVVCYQVLVPLELGPGNITLMVVLDQNTPAAPVALHASKSGCGNIRRITIDASNEATSQ
jgi:hypothetical protein